MSRYHRFLFILLLVPAAIFVRTVPGLGQAGTRQPKLLLVSFDGFRYDYLAKTATPNFDSFIEKGVKAESLIPVFPTKTFPNHYSIVTGLYPEHSGIVANTMYDPEWDRWYRISDREAVENPAWYQGEPIWNTAEKQGLKTGTMFWVGSEADIQGMHPARWKQYDESMTERARIDTVVSWLSQDVDLATLYFELVDDAGHRYGLKSDSLIAAIQKSDKLIAYLREKLQEIALWNVINIIIVSDHGMVELSADKVIELDTMIDLNNIDWLVWNPVTMIQPKEPEVESVFQKIKQSENHYRVYRKENLPERYHLKNHRRVPDIIMVADPGYTIVEQHSKQRFLQSLPSATHGFDNNVKEMHGFFAARGPAFVSGDTVESFKNIHIYELMSYIMGIRPAPNDGSLDNVRVFLKSKVEW